MGILQRYVRVSPLTPEAVTGERSLAAEGRRQVVEGKPEAAIGDQSRVCRVSIVEVRSAPDVYKTQGRRKIQDMGAYYQC